MTQESPILAPNILFVNTETILKRTKSRNTCSVWPAVFAFGKKAMVWPQVYELLESQDCENSVKTTNETNLIYT